MSGALKKMPGSREKPGKSGRNPSERTTVCQVRLTRTLDRAACEDARGVKLSHCAEALRRRGIHDDVVNIGQGRAPLGKGAMEFTLSNRCDIGDDCPAIATVATLEHLSIRVGRYQVIAAIMSVNGKRAEEGALSVG